MDKLKRIKGILGLLAAADAVRVWGSPLLTDWSVAEEFDPENPEDEVIYFSWEGAGQDYSEKLTVEDLLAANMREGMFLIPDEDQGWFRLEMFKLVSVIPSNDCAPNGQVVAVCSKCGGRKVVRDATAAWSSEDNRWELAGVQDHATCEDCNDDCDIEFKEVAG